MLRSLEGEFQASGQIFAVVGWLCYWGDPRYGAPPPQFLSHSPAENPVDRQHV